jgi:hypothetical protein
MVRKYVSLILLFVLISIAALSLTRASKQIQGTVGGQTAATTTTIIYAQPTGFPTPTPSPTSTSTTSSLLTTSTTSTLIPTTCEVIIDPAPENIYTGETIQFNATESGDCDTPCLTWEITSNSGSMIDDNGLYTAGNIPGTDEVTVIDPCNGDISDTATVTISYQENYEVSITPENKIIASGGTVNFSAETKVSTSAYGFQLTPPDYEWSVNSEIDSNINTSTGAYTAGENLIGHQATDVITAIDHANGDAEATAEIIVTYGEITVIFPSTILASRWIFLPYLCFLLGENLNINFSTILHFEPDDDIITICQFGFGNCMLFMILTKPNPVNSEVNIIVDTDGELAVSNDLPLNIGMLPWILDEENRSK